MTVNSAFDQTIPVLTELFSDKATAIETTQVIAASAPAQPAGAIEHDAIAAALTASLSAAEWTVLERRLSERVLQQLQSRVDFVLEQRLRDSMAEVLQHALAGLTAEIRSGLQDTIEKIVVRAVSQELTHLQTLKNLEATAAAPAPDQ